MYQVGSIVRFGFGDNDFVAFSLQTHHLLQLMLGATISILFQFRFGHFTADYYHLFLDRPHKIHSFISFYFLQQ